MRKQLLTSIDELTAKVQELRDDVAALKSERKAESEALSLQKNINDLKKQVSNLEIEKAKRLEEFARKLQYDQNNPTRITVDSIEDIKLKTILKINSELCRVKSISYELNEFNGYYVGLDRNRNVLGTDTIDFSGISVASIMSGNYNIAKDIIDFSDSPLEGISYDVNVPVSDLNYSDFSFNLFTDRLETGSQVVLNSLNPPSGLKNSTTYYIIKNFQNNFSFAESYLDATSNIPTKIEPVFATVRAPHWGSLWSRRF